MRLNNWDLHLGASGSFRIVITPVDEEYHRSKKVPRSAAETYS